MKTNDTLPIWKPWRDTRIDLPELCFMHRGPAGVHLPEHEHSEVQLELHFLAKLAGTQHRAADPPAFLKLIPTGKPHVGRWRDGDEVVVVLLGQEYIARTMDAVANCVSSSIVDVDCAVDPVIQALSTTLRRECVTRSVSLQNARAGRPQLNRSCGRRGCCLQSAWGRIAGS